MRCLFYHDISARYCDKPTSSPLNHKRIHEPHGLISGQHTPYRDTYRSLANIDPRIFRSIPAGAAATHLKLFELTLDFSRYHPFAAAHSSLSNSLSSRGR
ncbi:hypothetical protein PTI98_004213 [Pleurotus ostreatus]|nr:hypothetical protein PTI98_004213 [Pleurotus ostreatus]